MSKKLLLCLIALLLFANLGFSQQRKSKNKSGEAKIFYVNLYSTDVDVRLGDEDNYVFISNGIGTYNATYMVSTTSYGDYSLYYKNSSDDKYEEWIDEKESPYSCPVESGKNYCILIDSENVPHYLELTEDSNTDPKVCFLNGTSSDLTRMAVGTDWSSDKTPSNDIVAYSDGLDKDMITSFVSVTKGNYSCYWQFPRQVKKGNYYFYPDDSGKKAEVFKFEKGKYYIFFAFTEDGSDYAKLIDITQE